MNKLIKILFLVNLLIFNKVIANPNINIKTGILMDYHSDEVLFEIDSIENLSSINDKDNDSIIAFDLLKVENFLMTDTFYHGKCMENVQSRLFINVYYG